MLRSVMTVTRSLVSYKRVSIGSIRSTPRKKKERTPYTRPACPAFLLLPRDSKQVHVRLDVNIMSDRVDAFERVCDLPVEVPEQLRENKLSIVSLCPRDG
jgi:hypothetical protein